jgi:serine/threonine protein kinase
LFTKKPIIVVEFSVAHVNLPVAQNDLLREQVLTNAFRIASIGPSLTLVERIFQRDIHLPPSSAGFGEGNSSSLQSILNAAAGPLQRLCVVIAGGGGGGGGGGGIKSSIIPTSTIPIPSSQQPLQTSPTKSPIRERLTRIETRTSSTLEAIPILFDGIPVDGEETKETSNMSSSAATAPVKRPQHVGLSDFDIKAVIGRGGYGYVFVAKRAIPDPAQIDGERLFAIKMMRKDMVRGRAMSISESKPASTVPIVPESSAISPPPSAAPPAKAASATGTNPPANLRVTVSKRAMAERNILASVSKHPFLVGLRYAFQTREHLFIVTDLCSGGDLYTHLQRKGTINLTRLALYAAELVLALDHLHKAVRVVYRDLKPENVLLDGDGHLRLTDFGLSYVNESVDAEASGLLTSDGPAAKVSFCGTESFMAPEVLLRNAETGCSPVVDFWSLGVLLYEAFTGRHPFRGDKHIQTLRNIASKSAKPAGLDKLPVLLANLIEGLLEKNPNKRLGSEPMGGIAQLKKHPFFSLPLGYPMFDGSVLTANHSLSNRGGLDDNGVVPGYVPMDFDLVLAKAYLPLYAPNKDASVLVVNSTVDPALAHFDVNFLQIPVKLVLDEIYANQAKSAAVSDSWPARDRDGSLAAFSFAGGTSIDGDEDWNKLLKDISTEREKTADATAEDEDVDSDDDSDTSSFYDYEEEFELGDLVNAVEGAPVVTEGGSAVPWTL